MKILIIEEKADLRQLYEHDLQLDGYDVVTTDSARRGLTMLESTSPDLVIVDLQLTDMSGLAATRQIIQMEEMKDVPVVALTPWDVPGKIEELARVGCRGYITKPIDTNLLASQIQVYLEE